MGPIGVVAKHLAAGWVIGLTINRAADGGQRPSGIVRREES